MKLNHLNLTVTDVPAARAFLEKYFDLEPLLEGSEKFSVVSDGEGFILTLMKGEGISYPDTFHVGFIQESEERVDEINARMKSDGYDVEPPKRFHGSWTFYFEAPGGFTVEVLS